MESSPLMIALTVGVLAKNPPPDPQSAEQKANKVKVDCASKNPTIKAKLMRKKYCRKGKKNMKKIILFSMLMAGSAVAEDFDVSLHKEMMFQKYLKVINWS